MNPAASPAGIFLASPDIPVTPQQKDIAMPPVKAMILGVSGQVMTPE
jgi:hypothetical protein